MPSARSTTPSPPAPRTRGARASRALRRPAAHGTLILVALVGGRVHAQPWLQFGRDATRIALASTTPAPLASPRWIRSLDQNAQPITFQGQAGPVADSTRVFAVGRSAGLWKLFALDAATGAVLWAAPVPTPTVDSWSTPALDPSRGLIAVAAGTSVSGFDVTTGQLRWTTPLPRPVVNASPLIAGDPGVGRLLITDYDGFASSAQLHCINIDPFNLAANPFQPGAIVWSRSINGSSGNSPAAFGSVVYVASAAGPGGFGDAGEIRAFPLAGDSNTPPLWTFSNPAGAGFFGGVSLTSPGSSLAVLAASYAFGGGVLSANLVKVDAASGALLWSTPSNRTSSTPIPLPGGFVALSAGLDGFGTVPSIQLFRDLGDAATLTFDTALDTWNDSNASGTIDPGEYLRVGGWTVLPAAAPLGRAPGPLAPFCLYAGALQVGTGTSSACAELLTLDLSRPPSDPAFIVERISGAGSTPAIVTTAAGAWLYTVGSAGLHAFGPAPCWANCDASTTPPVLNAGDFACFLSAFRAAASLAPAAQVSSYANCDASTTPPVLNAGDFACFLSRFRGGCP